jgi:hypothetical protein
MTYVSPNDSRSWSTAPVTNLVAPYDQALGSTRAPSASCVVGERKSSNIIAVIATISMTAATTTDPLGSFQGCHLAFLVSVAIHRP